MSLCQVLDSSSPLVALPLGWNIRTQICQIMLACCLCYWRCGSQTHGEILLKLWWQGPLPPGILIQYFCGGIWEFCVSNNFPFVFTCHCYLCLCFNRLMQGQELEPGCLDNFLVVRVYIFKAFYLIKNIWLFTSFYWIQDVIDCKIAGL